MARTNRTTIDLGAGPLAAGDVAVRRAVGVEALSEPFWFDVDFEPRTGEAIDMGDLLGADALLSMALPEGAERLVHATIWSAEMTGVDSGKPSYRVRLAPKLARLAHVRRTRVFQSMSVPEVVKAVLDEGECAHRDALAGSRPTREYCVQYRESDLDFVSRLLEEEGIFYWFEHGEGGHVLVLAEDRGGCADLPGDPAVPFRSEDQAADAPDDEHVFRMRRTQRVRPGKTFLRDHDFERPALDVSAECRASGDRLELEWFEYPAGFRDPGAGRAVAQRRLEELRFAAETFEGEGTCLRFGPGSVFGLAEHPEASFGRDLLLVRVRHEAVQQEGAGAAEAIVHRYRNDFVAIDAGLPCRPRRRTRRPVAWAETATVVGPASEEVHVDRHGRVKVQFHWDREGARDGGSSCWIRVAQAWAGPAWGSSFLPRVGQEVLVRFLDGDPDRPIVAGAVYNAQNPPPVQLPSEMTRSTLRSASSPGSAGANEVRLEDARGAEEIWVHAQRDESLEVLNDKVQRVQGKESLEVTGDRSLEVRGDQALRVGDDDSCRVAGRRSETIAGNRSTTVAGTSRESAALVGSVTVAKDRRVGVAMAAAETVGVAAALNVGGAYAVNVAAALNEAVAGAKAVQVGGERLEVVGASRSETVAKDSAARVGGDLDAEVKGGVHRETGKDHQEDVGGKVEVESKKEADWSAPKLELSADKLSIVVGGKLALSIDGGGKVVLGCANLVVDGKSIALKGAKLKKSSGGGASSGSASVRQLQPMPGDRATVEIALADQDGRPVANEWFKVEFPDGTVREGRLDGKGRARVPGPKEGNAKVTFPRLHRDAWKKKQR